MKIAILGSAPSSLHLAPFGDPSWKIWGCSPGVYAALSRCDAFFELHRWEPGLVGKPHTQKQWFSPEYVAWMGQRDPQECPVWMYQPVPEIPASRALPIDDIKAKYGTYFLTSSISIMLACAIEDILEAREMGDHSEHSIGLFGVDMAACTSGDAKILTADLRWVRAEELNVGDKLMAFDEDASADSADKIPQRRWRVAEVLEASRLTKPCYRLTLEDGRELICSEDHRWLTHSENQMQWRMAKDMVTPHHRENRPSKIVQLTDMWVEDKSWEAGYLAAAFDGEGHLSQKLREGDNGVLRAGFAQRENVMSETVLSAMKDRGFDLTQDGTCNGANGDCVKYTVKGGRAENLRFLGSIRPKRLLDKFDPEQLGMMHKSGKVAVVKAEFIGDHPVIGLRTSTKTFVCEGLASHNTEEYGYQRAGCQHFLELAANLGIQIVVPPESDLLRPMPVYGICESSHWMIKNTARKRELEGRLAQANAQLAMARDSVNFLNGALDDLNYQMLTWGEDREGTGTSFGILAKSPHIHREIMDKQYPEDSSAQPCTVFEEAGPVDPKAFVNLPKTKYVSPVCLGEMENVPRPKPRLE